MKKTAFTIFILTISAIFFNNAFADASKFDNPFVSFGPAYQPTPGSVIEIANMPPVRSQDGIGICYSFVAAGLLDKYQCMKHRKDCRNINQSERVSVLDLAQEADDNFILSKSIKMGGTTYNTLTGFLYSGEDPKVAKESCAPFDSVVNKYSDDDKTQDKTFNWLEDVFNKAKSKEISCLDCVASEVQSLFPGLRDKKLIIKAFGKPDFGQFLYHLAVPDRCLKIENRIVFPDNLGVGSYPDEEHITVTAVQIKTKIIDILKSGKPVGLNGICTDQKKDIPNILQCKSYHAVIAIGYSTMCSPKGKCHEAFKVMNSWGESWQRANSDGWVLADQLTGRVGGVVGAINWIE